MRTDGPRELTDGGVRLLYRFSKVLEAHDALAEAFAERTGLALTKSSEFTLLDMRRASRILRAKGIDGAELDSLLALRPKDSD